jgi:leucyl-tRNA synthetase
VDVPLQRYGADTTRLYEMFMGPLESTKPWSMQGVEGISRFLNRAWRMIIDEASETMQLNPRVTSKDAISTEEQLRTLHKTIQVVTRDMESLSFNTAISRLMEFVNYFTGQETRPFVCMEAFVLLLSPMAPHISEELWQALGHSDSLAFAPWPEFDSKYVQESTIEMPVQIKGKVRGRIIVPIEATEDEIKKAALDDSRVKKYLEGSSIQKVIVIPKKLINIVTG